MKGLYFAAAVLCVSLAGVSAEAAQCASRDHVVGQLQSRFGETLQAVAYTPDNATLEVFSSAQTKRWTITLALPDGMSCLVATGRGFEKLNAQMANSAIFAYN
ncbi:MAG: hypothetical protein R3D84_12880 [Paracoccaceae bacterium]